MSNRRLILRTKEKYILGGVSTLRVWEPGVIAELLAAGYPIDIAEKMAMTKGSLFKQLRTHNLIVNTGNEFVAMLLSQGGANGLTHHAIGTSATAPAAGDTLLGAEVNRKTWTLNGYVSNVLSLSVYYGRLESTFNLKEAAVFGGPDASMTPNTGTLFSHYPQPYDNSAGTHDITYDYDLTVGA